MAFTHCTLSHSFTSHISPNIRINIIRCNVIHSIHMTSQSPTPPSVLSFRSNLCQFKIHNSTYLLVCTITFNHSTHKFTQIQINNTSHIRFRFGIDIETKFVLLPSFLHGCIMKRGLAPISCNHHHSSQHDLKISTYPLLSNQKPHMTDTQKSTFCCAK